MVIVADVLVSVIVPVYQVEKYVERCANSIMSQTYKNLEIIFVDDGSSDRSCEIIEELKKSDNRIKIVHHKKNSGLFQARITGVQNASGKYLLFVDSDDCISVDWVRLLVDKAELESADVVLGDFVLLYPDGSKKYHSLDPIRCQDIHLVGDEILDAFMCQSGHFYGWHTCWNKLYSAELWKKILPDLTEFSNRVGKVVMTEDIAFSSAVYTNATRVVNVHNSYYCYYKGNDSSTASTLKWSKLSRDLANVKEVFSFFRKQLEKKGLFSKYENYYNDWLSLYGRIWWEKFDKISAPLVDRAKIRKEILSDFHMDEVSVQEPSDYFLYTQLTDLAPSSTWYDDIKRYIALDWCKVVSFDIFDTLVMRPFFYPTDLFVLLDGPYRTMTSCSSQVLFSKMRVDAEVMAREDLINSGSQNEDITIDDIYAKLGEYFSIPSEVLNEIKALEKKLEIRYCYPRKTGKELFSLAKELGKEVVFISDMYLDEDTVNAILEKCGYYGYNLYLSSSKGVTKFTGHLFSSVIEDMGINNPSTICHIGDNWQSDVTSPSKLGIKAFQLCKTTDMLTNSNPGIYSGDLYRNCMYPKTAFYDSIQGFKSYFGTRCFWAVVANKIFDNPYVSVKKGTDFNQNPFYLGYCALGMHMLAISKWICESEKRSGVKRTIHFVARDGYLPKRFFEVYNSNPDTGIDYLHVSRKALLTADMGSPSDLYSIYYKMNILNVSPNSLVDALSPIFDDSTLKKIKSEIMEIYENPDNKFSDKRSYEEFIKFLIDNHSSQMDFDFKDSRYRKLFSKRVCKGDAIFDVGYGGRTEASLSHFLGFPVNSYYIHTNSDVADQRESKYGFSINLFYNHKPAITGVMREHLMMDMAPSTIGYDFDAEKPIFDDYEIDYPSYIMTKIAQDAAVQFAKDINDLFGSDLDLLYSRSDDLSVPFEHYLHSSAPDDRQIFGNLTFEDNLGEGKVFNAVDFWNNDISRVAKQRNWQLSSSETAQTVYISGEPEFDEKSAPGRIAKKFYNFERLLYRKFLKE